MGRENTHDTGEEASADLWEMKKNTSLGSQACTHPPHSFSFVSQFVYCLWAGGRDEVDDHAINVSLLTLHGNRQHEFDPLR